MTILYKEIANLVVMAQIESDAAKQCGYDYEKKQFHYKKKAEYINKAIALLKHNPLCGIGWREVKAPDQNGYKSRITYFDFYIYGKKVQISFHGFDHLNDPNSGVKSIEWDHLSSRQSCRVLNNRCKLHLIIQKD